MNLIQKIINIYPTLTINDLYPFSGTIIIQNDGKGDYIAKWEHPTLPKPTDAQLA